MPGKGVIAATISVEAIGLTFDWKPRRMPVRTAILSRWQRLMPIWAARPRAQAWRGDPAGGTVDGPALITEATATIVEPGWQAEMTGIGNLVLRRVVAREERVAIGTSCDPVMLEVFNNLFMSIAEQMGYTLQNTALSVNEGTSGFSRDFRLRGIADRQRPAYAGTSASMGDPSAPFFVTVRAIKPGDLYVLNNPYNGGTHLPDITVITPVFDEGEILFFVARRGHHPDVGEDPGIGPAGFRAYRRGRC